MSEVPSGPTPGANDCWVCVNPDCKELDIPKYAIDTSRNPPGLTDVKCGSCWQSCERRPLATPMQS